MYVVFEGIDTSGKTTQINLLKEKFNDIIITKEPGGTIPGIKMREILLHEKLKSHIAEIFLFLADRAELINEVIKPNINSFIVSDRSFISGIAYAMTNKDMTLNLDKLIELNLIALEGILPDIVFLFIADEETILKRLGSKKQDNIEKRGIKYLFEVQKNLKTVTKKLNIKTVEIDASDTIENIHNIITRNIK